MVRSSPIAPRRGKRQISWHGTVVAVAMSKPKVMISLLTEQNTKQTAFCYELLQCLFRRPEIAPEFAGNWEPVNNAVSTPEAALRYCDQDVIWLRKHAIVSQGSLFHTYPHRTGAIHVQASFDPSFDWLSLFRDLVLTSGAYYGYLHLRTDREWERTSLSPEDRQTFLFLGPFSHNLAHGILDLGWANYLDQRWKRQINPIKLANTCSRMEHVQGGYLFAITDTLADVGGDYESFDARRGTVKEAFGDSFFRLPTNEAE
jgi:hypothetical protein